MDRRELLGVLGATAAGLTTVTSGSALAQESHAHKEGDIHEKCAASCRERVKAMGHTAK